MTIFCSRALTMSSQRCVKFKVTNRLETDEIQPCGQYHIYYRQSKNLSHQLKALTELSLVVTFHQLLDTINKCYQF